MAAPRAPPSSREKKVVLLLRYGKRSSTARSLQVPSLTELAQDRALKAKPRIPPRRERSSLSEKAQLEISKLKADGAAVNVLGGTSELDTSHEKRGLASLAEEAWQTLKQRKILHHPQSHAAQEQASGSTGASSSSSVPTALTQVVGKDLPDSDWSRAADAIRRQAKVGALRKEAFLSAKPGEPAAFIDSKGGQMKRKAELAQERPVEAPRLADNPVILFATTPGARKPEHVPSRHIKTTFPDPMDAVVVTSLTWCWDTPEALLARLEGAHLLDESGKKVVFKGVKHNVLYVDPSFAETHPRHMQALEAYARRSPLTRQRDPRLQVLRESMPEAKELKWPSLTHLVVAKVQDSHPKNTLDLKGLLRLFDRCYE